MLNRVRLRRTQPREAKPFTRVLAVSLRVVVPRSLGEGGTAASFEPTKENEKIARMA
jgi:hypothetical protein